jgi:hypothetical protein
VVGVVDQQNAQAQVVSAGQAQARYQVQAAEQNRQLMRQREADALQRGQVAEENRRRLTAQQIGQQRDGLAAQGTESTCTETDIPGYTAMARELDARTVRANAAREAYRYQVPQLGYRNEAILLNTRAASPTYLPINLGASLLSGASTLADKWRPCRLPHHIQPYRS